MSLQAKWQDRRIRTLIITHYLDKGGLEEVILMYAKFLDKDKYEVAVAYRVEGMIANEIRSLAGVHVLCYDGSTRWKRFQKLLKFGRNFRPDIVHNHFNWYGLMLGFLLHARCVETIHNTYHWLPAFQKVWYGISCTLASRIIAVSDHVKQFSVGFFPFMHASKVVVVHNGIDTDRFRQAETDATLRTQLGIPDTDIVIGFLGRLEEQKGLGFLLQAADTLHAMFDHVWLVIVGDGSRKGELESQVRELSIPRVLFLRFQRDTPAYFHMFDIFALPSLFEGLPVSLLEAMSAGCPVVATRVGGVNEVVRDGTTGFLVDPRNVEQLAVALRRLVEDGEMRKRMGKLGQARAEAEFSVHAMITHTEKIYSELLGASSIKQ